MRGKITSCDNCRNKKIKCEGKNPCKHCFNQSISCTFSHVPKQVARSSKGTKVRKSDIVALKSSGSVIVKNNQDIGNQFSKLELLLNTLIKKLNKLESKTETSGKSKYTFTGTNSKLESYDRMISGDYFSASFFSTNGLAWAADRLQDPILVMPLKGLISNFVNLERGLLSAWVEPVDSSRFFALPPRNVIEGVFESKLCVFDFPFMDDARRLAFICCDYRDGLIPKRKFSYGELLFLNSCLLLACTLHHEEMKVGIPTACDISFHQIKIYEKLLFDNSLYYFHRISVLGDGLPAVEGLILLSFYADLYSVTLPLNSMTSVAVRQAQDLGLHREEYYIHLGESEKLKALTAWWICYYRDKSVALKTGKIPVIDDTTVTAEMLPFLPKHHFKTNSYGEPKASFNRASSHEEISQILTNYISSPGQCNKFYLMIKIDLSTIVSKMYKNLVLSPTHNISYVKYLLSELENWRLCFPESIRPGGPPSEYTKNLTYEKASLIFISSDLSFQYYHVKLVLNMFAVRAASGLEQEVFSIEGLDSARSLLRLAVVTGKNFLQISGFLIFYTFSAFLTIAAFCIQEPTRIDVAEDVTFLISCCRDLFSCFTQTHYSPEKWYIIGAVSRCVIYIVVNVVMEHNKKLCFNVGDILEEVSKIQSASSHIHLSPHLKERKTNCDRNSTTTRTSSSQLTSYSSIPSFTEAGQEHVDVDNKSGNVSDFDGFLGPFENSQPTEPTFSASFPKINSFFNFKDSNLNFNSKEDLMMSVNEFLFSNNHV